MALMQRFLYCPTQASYSHSKTESEFKRAQLKGGPGRYRRDIDGSSTTVNVRWVLDDKGYAYAMAFYSRFGRKPEPFIIPLKIEDGAMQDCEARFIPDTFGLTQVQGDTYTITARLEVIPPARDHARDDYLLSILSYYGPEWAEWLDRLHVIVNEELPEIMPYPPNTVEAA